WPPGRTPMSDTPASPVGPVMPIDDLIELETACEWRSDEGGDDYVFELTDVPLSELGDALRPATQRTDGPPGHTPGPFPPPALAPELRRLTHELIEGRGMVLIRGLPVDRYTKEEASTIYWGVGMHLGQPWPQNARGHLLGDVTDQGKAPNDPTSRGN